MRTIPILFALLAAVPLCAQQEATLQVNAAPTTEALTEATVKVAKTVASVTGETAVLDALMTFSRPTEALTAPSAEDKLTLAVDADGTIKVSNGTDWIATGATVPETGATFQVKVTTIAGANGLTFKVKVGDSEPVSVTSTVAGLGVSELLFDGEGSVTQLAMAAVNTAILPPSEDGQSPELVEKYAEWERTPEKGGAMGSASDTEKADAFAMNVGGKPTLTVTAIEPQADGSVKITVKGAYSKGDVEAEAPLAAINGKLYVTYSETLGETPTVEEVAVSAADGATVEITVPAEKKARFLKASVSLVTPEATL